MESTKANILNSSEELASIKPEPMDTTDTANSSLECAFCEYRGATSGEMASHRKWHVQFATRGRYGGSAKPEVPQANAYFAAAAALAQSTEQQQGHTDLPRTGSGQLMASRSDQIIDNKELLVKKRVYTPVREAVDPGKYMVLYEIDGTKYACTQCGNIYKWRKSLNKHWKEKHGSLKPTSGQNIAPSLLAMQGKHFAAPISSQNTPFPSRDTPTGSENTPISTQPSPCTKTSPLPGTLPSPPDVGAAYFISQLRRGCLTSSPEFRARSPEPRNGRHSNMDINNRVDAPLDLSKPSSSASTDTPSTDTPTTGQGGGDSRCYSRYEPYSEQPVTPPTSRCHVTRCAVQQPVTPYGDQDAACLYRQIAGEGTPPKTRVGVASDMELAAGGTVIVVPRSPPHQHHQHQHQQHRLPVKRGDHRYNHSDDNEIDTDDLGRPSPPADLANHVMEVNAPTTPPNTQPKANQQWINYGATCQVSKIYASKPYMKCEIAGGTCVADSTRPSLPYKCDSCEFRARWPSEINQHRKNHSSVKPYACPRCTYRSKWKWDVVKHLKRCGAGVGACVGAGVSVRDVIDHSTPPPPVSHTSHVVKASTIGAHPDGDARKTPAIARACKKCGFQSYDLSELLLHQKSHLLEVSPIFSLTKQVSQPAAQLTTSSRPQNPPLARSQSDPFDFSDGGSTIAGDSTTPPATPSPTPSIHNHTHPFVTTTESVASPALRRPYSEVVLSMRQKLKRSEIKRRRFFKTISITKSFAIRNEAGNTTGSRLDNNPEGRENGSADKLHKCRKCVYVTRSRKLYQAHVESRHSVEKPVSDAGVESMGSRNNAGVIATLTCDMCAYEVTSASDLQTHIAKVHVFKQETS